jgi:flagellar biogenesis protein FliO
VSALSPRQKLAAAGALTGLLAMAAALSSGSVTTGARVVLAVLALGALAVWAAKGRGLALPRRFAKVPRLQVVQKVGLSARAGVALVEVDGRSFLIVHGEGGTRVRRVSSRAAVMAQALKEDAS